MDRLSLPQALELIRFWRKVNGLDPEPRAGQAGGGEAVQMLTAEQMREAARRINTGGG